MVDKGIGVVIAIVGVASIAVILSKRSDTARVIQALFTGLSQSIRAAASPVTGR